MWGWDEKESERERERECGRAIARDRWRQGRDGGDSTPSLVVDQGHAGRAARFGRKGLR